MSTEVRDLGNDIAVPWQLNSDVPKPQRNAARRLFSHPSLFKSGHSFTLDDGNAVPR